jgi:hypothetical protein
MIGTSKAGGSCRPGAGMRPVVMRRLPRPCHRLGEGPEVGPSRLGSTCVGETGTTLSAIRSGVIVAGSDGRHRVSWLRTVRATNKRSGYCGKHYAGDGPAIFGDDMSLRVFLRPFLPIVACSVIHPATAQTPLSEPAWEACTEAPNRACVLDEALRITRSMLDRLGAGERRHVGGDSGGRRIHQGCRLARRHAQPRCRSTSDGRAAQGGRSYYRQGGKNCMVDREGTRKQPDGLASRRQAGRHCPAAAELTAAPRGPPRHHRTLDTQVFTCLF